VSSFSYVLYIYNELLISIPYYMASHCQHILFSVHAVYHTSTAVWQPHNNTMARKTSGTWQARRQRRRAM